MLIFNRAGARVFDGLSSISEVTSGASYEANKEKAKDSDNSFGERIGAGLSAAGDKIEEKAHGTKAEAYKQSL